MILHGKLETYAKPVAITRRPLIIFKVTGRGSAPLCPGKAELRVYYAWSLVVQKAFISGVFIFLAPCK